MNLIVGLGNPGEKYRNNRHNVGYMFVDYLINKFRITDNGLKFDKKSNSQNVKFVINNKELILSKPQTFMNLSGKVIGQLFRNFKLKISDLVVIHDDLDIPLGKFKIQKGVGPKLHNGIESIENTLRTKDFLRIRVGVDNRKSDGWIEGETYVLQDFTMEEKNILNQNFPKIFSRLKQELLIKPYLHL